MFAGSVNGSARSIAVSIGGATTPTYALKTNLKALHSWEIPREDRGLSNSLPSTRAVPRSVVLPTDHQLPNCARTGNGDHTICSAKMCPDEDWDEKARASFLEP